MANTVISAKGEPVDFDLLAIKNQMSSSPKSSDVLQRERFIDKKRRRNVNRKVGDMLAEQADSQRYAKEMMNSQQKAREQILVSNAESIDDIILDETPEDKSVITAEMNDIPQRLNRKINK